MAASSVDMLADDRESVVEIGDRVQVQISGDTRSASSNHE